MPEVENLTMHLAKKVGIKVAAHGLIKMSNGEFGYITKRFDRIGKTKKWAVEDLCQLSELAAENKYKSTSEKAGKILAKYSSNPGDDALRFFEIIVFSFLVGNTDMHLKNFSLIESKSGEYGLSPAYDLLSTQLLLVDKEELALSLNSKKSNLKLIDFLKLGQNLNIPDKVIENCIKKQIKAQAVFVTEIENCIMSDSKKSRFIKLIAEKCARLQI